MKLSWSHAVLYVRELDTMLDFYTNVLGFQVSDRGPMGEGGPEIIFMSQDPDEHHQLAMVTSRSDENPSNTVNHFAFRTGSFEDVAALNRRLTELGNIDILPLSHGNTLSVYFNDPEGNGIEVFWDTPWHVAQPQGEVWDPTLDKQSALDWVESTFKDEPTFVPREEYYSQRRAAE